MEALERLRLAVLLLLQAGQHFLSPNRLQLFNQRDHTKFLHLAPQLVPPRVLLPSHTHNLVTKFLRLVFLLVLPWALLASHTNKLLRMDLLKVLLRDSSLGALISYLGRVPGNLWDNLSPCTDPCTICRGHLL